ncbi:hypothetical protein HanPSC8_Chr15g0655031 [Helianthus annuus]|nr:hypothetical protein HanIR_Chr15g0741941 [Helianthus annuus]KAJ0830403.1 hypothetical protein HanPSC8_Chr15g0655031 [Helianthus annuus]
MTDLTRILNVFKYEWRSPWEVKHMTFSNFDTTICSKWSNFDTTISFVYVQNGFFFFIKCCLGF